MVRRFAAGMVFLSALALLAPPAVAEVRCATGGVKSYQFAGGVMIG